MSEFGGGTGASGERIRYLRGPQGIQGSPGAQGIQGIQGEPGSEWSPSSADISILTGGSTEYITAVQDGITKRTPSVQVINEKYDVHRSGAAQTNTAEINGAAFAHAITTVGAKRGGIMRIPGGLGEWQYDTTLTIPHNVFELCGDADRDGTQLRYTGAGIGINWTGLYAGKLHDFRLRSTTGTDGIRLGHNATIAWQHEWERLWVEQWPGNGIVQDHVEQCSGRRVYVEGCGGNGIKIDNVFGNNMDLDWHTSRAQGCGAEGWFVDGVINGDFKVEALNNGGLANFRTGYVYACKVFLDVEDTTNAQTKVGLRFVGERSNIKIGMAFGLAVGIQIGSSPGNFIEPSRFSNTVKPIEDLGANTRLVIFDGGNLTGSTYASAVGELTFPGRPRSSKGTTAQRPTLTTHDGGYKYYDTTLAAAGKPIDWTGTAWVDATGVVV